VIGDIASDDLFFGVLAFDLGAIHVIDPFFACLGAIDATNVPQTTQMLAHRAQSTLSLRHCQYSRYPLFSWPCSGSLAQQVWQLSDIHRIPLHLIARQLLRRRSRPLALTTAN